MSVVNWPETNNYFSFYGLVPVYDIDTIELKKLFLEKSKKFHPDFFGDDMAAQSRAIEVTAFNNKAFRILSQPIERIRYLIQLNDNAAGEDNKLPQDFLIEMLDLNEQIDAFEYGEKMEGLKEKIETEININLQQLKELLIDLINNKQWTLAKGELLKLNYLERLSSRLLVDND